MVDGLCTVLYRIAWLSRIIPYLAEQSGPAQDTSCAVWPLLTAPYKNTYLLTYLHPLCKQKVMPGWSVTPTIKMALSVISNMAETILCACIHENSQRSQINADSNEPSVSTQEVNIRICKKSRQVTIPSRARCWPHIEVQPGTSNTVA